MMVQIFEMLRVAFKACTDWTTSLIQATGSLNILLAAFSLVLVVGLLFMPMRGHNVASWIGDYKVGKIHKAQAANRKKQGSNGKKG